MILEYKQFLTRISSNFKMNDFCIAFQNVNFKTSAD